MRKILAAVLALALLSTPALAQADRWHAKAREILAKSIGFRTAAGHGKVPAMVAYLTGELKAGGVAGTEITIVPLEDTQALVVRIAGRDRARKPILFSAHMDVVDADPKDWTRDPFTLVEENGMFFGRGVQDNKAGVTGLIVTILRLKAEKLTPSRDLVFAFIGDEESTMRTTKLLSTTRKPLIDAEFAINTDAGGGMLGEDGKPLIYGIQGGEKTYADFELTVANPGGHSSAPRASNAIYELADALARVRAHRFPVEANALTRSSLAAAGRATPGDLGEAMRAFAASPVEGPAAERLSREPGQVGTLRTTCVATMLRGGHAPNALPQSAVATVNCRIFPGTPVAAVQAKLAEIAGPGVAIAQVGDIGRESPVSAPRADVTAAITKAIHASYPGVPIAYHQSSGATDGREYRAAGIPTYASSGIFMKSSDQFAHGLNERLPVASFTRSIDYLWALVGELAAPR